MWILLYDNATMRYFWVLEMRFILLFLLKIEPPQSKLGLKHN